MTTYPNTPDGTGQLDDIHDDEALGHAEDQTNGQPGHMTGQGDPAYGHDGQMTGQQHQPRGHSGHLAGQDGQDGDLTGQPRSLGQPGRPDGVLASLAASENLRQRRLEMLPLRGPGAVFTEPQGRTPGEATAPENLADLISSISVVGLVQPVLVEELHDDPDTAQTAPEAAGEEAAGRKLRLVSGERRLRAMRWGATYDPDNPQFAAIPAVVCPGPLSEAERRCWQLVENIAREDLQPGELAAALLLERCAIVEQKLRAADRAIPAEVLAAEDPVARWHGLEKLRGSATTLAAPWSEVLHRLGLQLSERRARQLVRAFAALPAEISADMDEAKIRLNTRITFTQLRAGREQAADEIWAALREQQRPDLLTAATHAELHDPELSSAEAIEAAERIHAQANTARAEKLTKAHDATPSSGAGSGETGADAPDGTAPSANASTMLSTVLDGLRSLARALRSGRSLPATYDTGSLRLQLTDLLNLLDNIDHHGGNGPIDADHAGAA